MGKQAWLFPGQGAQQVGMGRDLHDGAEGVRDLYDRAEAVAKVPIRRVSFEGPEAELVRTDYSQVCIFVASLAAAEIWRRRGGAAADVVLGLSLGEYSALVAAGALAFEDAVALVAARGRFMQACCEKYPGAMASVVGLGREAAEEAARRGSAPGAPCVVANYNSPRQVVLSGEKGAVERASAAAKELGARMVQPLHVAGAYHSPLMQEAATALAPLLRAAALRAPETPYVSNVTGRIETDPGAIRELLIRQVAEPIRFDDAVQTVKAQGVDRGAELGPGKVLAGLVKQVDRSIAVRSCMALADFADVAGGAR